MQFDNIQVFLKYYDRIKQRTRRLFPLIPPDKIEWTYQEGKFTIGDIIRHLGTIERHMYAENAQFLPSQYKGCGTEWAEGYQATIDFYEKMYVESSAIFSQLRDEQLQQKCMTPGNVKITLWKWLRAMAEHEIHHRGQLYMYLAMLGVETPPLYGLTSETVIVNSKIQQNERG